MRNGLPCVLGVWVLTASSIFAQSPPFPGPPVPPGAYNPSPAIQPGADVVVIPGGGERGVQQDNFQFWMRGEYLGWWVKNAPLPVSVVTGDPNNPTHELLNSSQKFGMFDGMRLVFGVWLDPNNNIGLETNFFFSLARRSGNFFASSDSNGNPTLAFPFTSQTPGAAGNYWMPITSPGLFAGNVLVASSLQLWGSEANGVFSLVRAGGFEWTALAGFRYVDLYEKLNISTYSANITTNPYTVLYQCDQFNTRNQFFGGQLGSQVKWQSDYFALDVTGKLALGNTHQVVDIQGYSSQTGPGGINGTFAGGFFTQPSNIGRFSTNQFSVIPAVELKLHIFVTPNFRAILGYDFMYWTQVLRPGNQIDHNINLSQSAIYGSGTLSGPASPTPLFERSDFWAHGLNLGFEFRF